MVEKKELAKIVNIANKDMSLILHPTIRTTEKPNYTFILQLEEKEIYVGNKESREAEMFDCMIEICNEGCSYDGLSYQIGKILQLKFNDVRTHDILTAKCHVSEFMKNCSGKLLIHCGEGVSRSPSILIMYLIENHNYNYNDAFNLISSKRYIKPNVGFARQLKQFSDKRANVVAQTDVMNAAV